MQLNDEEINKLLEECLKDGVSVTLNASVDEKTEALKICDEYINNGHIDIQNVSALSVYYIISKLSEYRQIEFFKENINYIREKDEDIFLYNMLAPRSLVFFLSLKVLKEIKKLDNNLLKKIINGNKENLFHGFSHSDYLEFYNVFFDIIVEMDNIEFINTISYHNKCCYDDNFMDSDNNNFKLQPIYNQEFIKFLLEKYEDKIATFNSPEMLLFVKYIDDSKIYKKLIKNNYDKLNECLININEYELSNYLEEIDESKQEILLNTFCDSIIEKHDINKILFGIKPSIVIQLYNKNPKLFVTVTMINWIKFCSKEGVFNEEFQHIFDMVKVDDIELLFDNNFFNNHWYANDVKPLKYVEEKYRQELKTNGVFEKIDGNFSIFSANYFKNLKEIKEKFKNNNITKSDKQYKMLLSNFICCLKQLNIINSIEGNNFKEIEKLFYKIVMGLSITIVYELSCIEEIALFNRIGHIDFNVSDFTVEQLEKYNVKQHRQLYSKFEKSNHYIKNYKKFTLKLMLMVGFNHAKLLLQFNDKISVLEHLVGNVDVKKIKLNENGDPILNSKIMNLLFSNKDYAKIKEMLLNEGNDLYKYFPRIFNEWEMIKINGKDKTLNTIIDFLKSDEITVPPEYYRLNGLFKYIGCSNSIVNEVLTLHDQILNRTESSIPRISGKKGCYSYEILRLDDMSGLAVGNKTDCCFTVLGNGYSCFKHAVTSKNGRILVIKKNNEILAHSWLWRNGNLLCLDNIETSKKITQVDFFDVYLQLFDEIIKTSFEAEGIDSCLKNITIGFTHFDKKINGIENYPCLISKTCDLKDRNFGDRLGKNRRFVNVLPQPLEDVCYSDSKNVQYLIRGNGNFDLGQIYYCYKDEIQDETKLLEKKI